MHIAPIKIPKIALPTQAEHHAEIVRHAERLRAAIEYAMNAETPGTDSYALLSSLADKETGIAFGLIEQIEAARSSDSYEEEIQAEREHIQIERYRGVL